MFEDNGETGYFYACERSGERTSILDAVHIYNVRNVIDREIESRGEIVWSSDGLKAQGITATRAREIAELLFHPRAG